MDISTQEALREQKYGLVLSRAQTRQQKAMAQGSGLPLFSLDTSMPVFAESTRDIFQIGYVLGGLTGEGSTGLPAAVVSAAIELNVILPAPFFCESWCLIPSAKSLILTFVSGH